jgi:hypothetical protein
MDWIKALESEKKSQKRKSEPYETYGTNAPNPFLCGKNEGKGYPIPLDEETFARDERTAIVEFDGGGRDDLIENVIRIFQGCYAQRAR